MKTLIFEAVSGFAEYHNSDGNITVNYNINSNGLDEKRIYKIYALSSKKPFNKPLITDTLEFISGIASGKRELSRSVLMQSGFCASDIDTFAIVKTDEDGEAEEVSAACFASLKWDVEGAFLQKRIKVCAEEIKHPAERGRELMESIRERTKTKDPSVQKMWLDILADTVKCMKKSDESPLDGYDWYISEDIRPPIRLSAYKHLLFVTEVISAFDRYGYYLFGVKENGHTALAIKSNDINPFVNANDCASKIGDYRIVGIYLAPDGQYFEKIPLVE